MSETAAETDDADEASQEQTAEPTRDGSSSGGGLDDYVSEAEQAIIKEWLVYATGLFATVGLALGLNFVIQDQWNHQLLSASGGGGLGTGIGAALSGMFMWTIFMIGVAGAVLLGVAIGRNVDNEEYTGYKVAAVTAIVGLPILSLIGGLLLAQSLDNIDLEFVNTLVSGLGAGIAAAIGAAISIYLTEGQSPEELR